MQFIRKDYRISLTGYSQYFTLVGIKFHGPILLPFFKSIEIVLENIGIC